jgi:redox-sensitive bicupin YhaK (pirin superfamily)
MMKKNENQKNRRAFLGKLTLGSLGVALSPFVINSKTVTDNRKQMNKIKRVKAMGFQWETMDPFLFCVHHEDNYPVGNENLGPDPSLLNGRQIGQDFLLKDGWRMYHGASVPGFPQHPHRGFETITVVREGLVDHADSTGAAGRYGNGDVQWMTAGKGVLHSEMFPLLKSEKENPLELFQIWINLPKRNKMVDPHFKMMWTESIPVYTKTDVQKNKVMVETIAGSFDDSIAPTPPPNSWAHEKENDVMILNIHMDKESSLTIPKSEQDVNRMAFFYEGANLQIDDTTIPDYHSIELDGKQNVTFESGDSAVKILILQGKPINEPVVQHGPFVMNTREEIQQAFMDYQQTQFGGWPWPNNDQTHGKEKQRFAKHSDGREELKT